MADAPRSTAPAPAAGESDGTAASNGTAATHGTAVTEGVDVAADAGERADDPSADAESTARRTRLQALAGATVLGSDGDSVGRVRDIYLDDASGELAAIAVVRRQLSSRSVLIPASAIAVLPAQHPARDGDEGEPRTDDGAGQDGSADVPPARPRSRRGSDAADPGHPQALWLLVAAEIARAGTAPPVTSHVSPELLRESARVLGLEEAPAG